MAQIEKEAGPRFGQQLPVQEDVHTVGAWFSPCGTWRYSLVRVWGRDSGPVVAFIGMNPSSADELHDDRTVRRCIGFARDWGYAGMVMLNTWAVRGTDPAHLEAVTDPVGPENDEALAMYTASDLETKRGTVHPVGLVVAAWGAIGSRRVAGRVRGEDVTELVTRYRDLYCLGQTRGGQPRHPLYLPRVIRPEIYAQVQGAPA